MKNLSLVIVVTAAIMSGFVPYASAAQLDAAILFGEESAEPSFQFLRVVYIEYPYGGEIAESLRGERQEVSFTADSNTPGINELVMQLNHHLQSTPSNATVSDAEIYYQAVLQGNQDYAVIEYKVKLTPTITDHVVAKEAEKSTVDANWRGISIDKPIIVQIDSYGSFDVNNPRSALDVMIPEISEKLNDVAILELPLIDASHILSLPLHKWHSLFDNTAIIQGAVQYNYTGKNVITHYSMGECNIEIGSCSDREWVDNDIDFLDTKYSIRAIESRDDATIAIEGYVDSTVINGIEVFQTNLKSQVTQKPDTDEFPATVMYGMAGFAVVGGAVMFVISNRKLKKDKDEGQTGVDPAHLITYETSNSTGGYKTNRGESYLISNQTGESKTPL